MVSLEGHHMEQIGAANRRRLLPPASCSAPARAWRGRVWFAHVMHGFRFPVKAVISISVHAPNATTRFSRISNRIEGRVTGEQIPSGRGLRNLYLGICAADKITPTPETPVDITSAGLDGSNPQAAETLDLFATYLGRLRATLALIFHGAWRRLSSGGIRCASFSALKPVRSAQPSEDKAPRTGHHARHTGPRYHISTGGLNRASAFARTPAL